MKRFWQKTNRGLWLGLALLVFLFGFIVVREVRFQLEKKTIKATAKQYVVDLIEVNRATADAAGGELLTEAQKQTQKAMLEEVIGQYWYQTAKNDLFYNGFFGVSDLRQKLIEWQRYPQNKVTDFQISEPEISVSEEGPNHAFVMLRYSSFLLTVHGYRPEISGEGGETGVLFPDDPLTLDDAYGDWNIFGTLDVSLRFERHKGKWYVVSMYFSSSAHGNAEGGIGA